MKVKDIQAIIPPSARIRIRKSEKEVLHIAFNTLIPPEYEDREVQQLIFATDVCHKDYINKGLRPPMEPGLPASLSIRDLDYRIYYGIYILGDQA